MAAMAIGVLLTIAAGPPAVVAQDPPAHYAITGVRIVTGTGAVIDSGTILIRDGLIEAIGASVDVPAAAWRLDGSGHTAYPGLIDALTTVALPGELREAQGGPGRGGGSGDDAEPYAWGPEDRPATSSWVRAADHLELRDARITGWREAGFTTVVTAPERGLFPGRAAVIDLAGERPNDMVVATPVATHVKFDKGRGYPGYPNSLMGSLAYVTQTLLDADHYDQAWRIYEAQPAGLERPRYDRALEPLRPAVDREEPVLFPAVRAKEIDRVLRLARETGVEPILYGAHEGWKSAERLAASDTPVLVSLDWPQPPRDADPEAEESLETLRFRDRAPTTPGALERAGATFALYSGGLEPGEVLPAVSLAIRAGLSEAAALRALTLTPAEIFGVQDRVGSLEAGKIANVLLVEGGLFDGGSVRTVIVDGRRFEVESRGGRGEAVADDADDVDESAYEPVPMVDDRGPVREDATVLIRGATLLTAAEPFRIDDGDILIREGRIAEVGSGLEAPAGAWVIDGEGLFVSPGIIDAHSHIASDATNEGAVSVSAMVGIEDVLDPDDIGIYRAAAGGVTAANILHGSANPIGGKNAVIKMRWGGDADDLLVDDAPPGIKFALGENTKRDRNPDRYPNSRMGVIDVIRQSFLDAQRYREEGRIYEQALADGEEDLIPPRRDLKLDALVEILEGERFVHAHSYRADEILQLLRVAEEFGFKIRTLQHVLEGYRVADEIAAHGAGASTFSDWWAYKVEAYEAIPHNAALMNERGVLVSINSDSGEEMRHLNQEAAKTMKWGGASEEDALAMVTINPAIQLGIDHRTGSIEEGKDADLVVWDEHPLSVYAVPLMTFIDGKLWFDREHDRQLREQLAAEKRQLLEKHAPEPARERGRDTDTHQEAGR